jgi:hypothetical protein
MSNRAADSNENTEMTTAEPQEKPQGRLSAIWKSVAKRMPTKNTLKKAFTPAALGIAAGVGAKIAAMAAGAAVLGPVFTVCAGVGLTTRSFVKDYKAQQECTSSFDFFKDNWKRYSLTLALNSTSAFIGFGGAEWVAGYFSGAEGIVSTISDTPVVDSDAVDATLNDTKTDAGAAATDGTGAESEAEAGQEEIIEEPAIVIPDDPYEKLKMLAETGDLSPQAMAMIEAAEKGQTWAIRDIGLGLINGFYGFDELGEMAAHVNVNEWGAALLKDAVETGDAKARIDYAYFEYTGVNEAIAQNQEAALKTVEELDRAWLYGDSVLEQVHFDQAKELFIANMPEGTNIDDFRIEKMADDGYKFINLAEEAKVIAEQKIAMAAAGLDPADCDVTANADNNGFTIKNCKMQP